MRCSAYCTAGSFQLNAIADYFRKENYEVKFYRGVLYVFNAASGAEIFFLPLGVFVCWGLKHHAEISLIQAMHPFAKEPAEIYETDFFVYSYAEETRLEPHERYNIDIITLESDEVVIKLAISYGIAQSVKLQVYEETVLRTIEKNKYLPQELAKTGRIPLTGKAISRRLGEIFLEQTFVNLSSEYLGMPEYFWKYPRLEKYYTMTEKYLDIPSRVNTLNQRLKILHEFFDMLTGQLQHRHSTILEVIIIVLILIEVILSFRVFFV